MPSIAIVGASENREKFGNKALRAYTHRGWTVHPVHPTAARVEGHAAVASLRDLTGPVDRVAFYVPALVGRTLLADVARLAPTELWLNPGSESPELLEDARALGLEPIQACAIVDIGESSQPKKGYRRPAATGTESEL